MELIFKILIPAFQMLASAIMYVIMICNVVRSFIQGSTVLAMLFLLLAVLSLSILVFSVREAKDILKEEDVL